MGHTLAGIIFEFAALILDGFDTPLGAQDGILVQLGAEGAVGTGTFYSLPKQHFSNSIPCRYLDYTPLKRGMLLLFCIFRSIRPRNMQ